jgi:hypothetical protein
MNPHRPRLLPLLACLLPAIAALPAAATEGALGRSITGVQIQAYAGIVPPEPGMQWSLGYVHYDGEIGASRPAPIAGQVSLGLRADIDLWSATGVYIWPTGEGRWNFASMVTAPYILPRSPPRSMPVPRSGGSATAHRTGSTCTSRR